MRAGRQRQAWTLAAAGLGLFTVFLDASIVNVALPAIQDDFDTGESGLQWVVAGYSVTMAMFMMAGGTLGDARGRRLAYVGGLVLFGLASLACSAATGIEMLALARGIQGVGAAVVNVASLALVGAAFPDPGAKTRAIGIWTGIAAVGFGLGPAVGGLLTEHVGWRSVFLINPVVALVAIALTLRFVAESRDPAHRGFDLPGQVLFVVSVGALTFALIQGPHRGWLSPVILGALAAAVATLAAFVVLELRAPAPMMDVHVFRQPVFSTAIAVVFAVLFCVYGTLLVITQYFQNVRVYSPERAGLITLSLAAPVVVLAPLTGSLVERFGRRRPALAGLSCAVVGTGILAVGGAARLGVTVLALMLIGAAAGISVAAATGIAMGTIPPERSGMASGIVSTQRGLGSTAGFAIMGSVLASVVAATLPDRLEPVIPDRGQRTEVAEAVVDDANPQAAVAVVGPGKPLPDSVTTESRAVDAADDAFIAGIRAAMAVAAAVCLLALVLAWLVLPRPTPGKVPAVGRA